MTIDPAVIPGLLLLSAELMALTGAGFLVARVLLGQTNVPLAMAQGMVIGPALWGLAVNFVLYLVPGRAGSLVGWALTLILGVWLARLAPMPVWPRPRVAMGFMVASLAVGWVVLAARQNLSIPDVENHLGLASQIQVGGYPPAFPWTPDLLAAYHHGFDLLVGLLAPPVGPDLAFTTELLGAYVWVCVVMLLGAALLKFGGWIGLLVLTPLVISPGLWTLVGGPPDDLVRIPVPVGIPAPGVRASLTDVYWPAIQLPWFTAMDATPPDIWKPNFKFSHALAFVVIERLLDRRQPIWMSRLVLAGLVGFLGLVDETVAVIAVGLWLIVEAERVLQECRFSRKQRAADIGRTPNRTQFTHMTRVGFCSIWMATRPHFVSLGAGPALAIVLLVVGGGAITGVLIGSSDSGLSLGWIDDVWQRRPLGSLEFLAGGVGLLGLGIVPVALGAVWLGRRNDLIITLVVAGGMSLLLALILQYEHGQHDIVRFDGHSRFFGLMALLLALSGRLRHLRLRWRIAAGAVFILLATWPTIGSPIRTLALGLNFGPHMANADTSRRQLDNWELNRYVITGPESQLVTQYIRQHTEVEARILSPDPNGMSIATGRPNASGLIDLLHFSYFKGPEYFDASLYLEPSSIRRLEIDYIHATELWKGSLPVRAMQWLDHPAFFKLVVQDGQDSLYRVLPAFRDFDPSPTPASYETLRRSVPPGASVYLPRGLGHMIPVHLRSTLSHARILSHPVSSDLHLRIDVQSEPLGDHAPQFVALPARLAPVGLQPNARTPVWATNNSAGSVAVYSLDKSAMRDVNLDPSFDIYLSNVGVYNGGITFTATFTDRVSEQWTGQDWIVAATDGSPWNLPSEFLTDEHTHAGTLWFGGQVGPGSETTVLTYVFDAPAGSLVVRDASGQFTAVPSSEQSLHAGVWTLMARLRVDHLEAAVIPIMTIAMTDAGDVSYAVYEGDLRAFLGVYAGNGSR